MSVNTTLSAGTFNKWLVPQSYFYVIDEDYGPFLLDVCATPQTAKCEQFYTPESDGLAKPWSANNWMNPPDNCNIDRWIKRAFNEAERGNTTVAFLPARFEEVFDKYIWGKHEVHLLPGCLERGDSESSAPFPAMLVVFRPHTAKL